jgi:hypothetical protein
MKVFGIGLGKTGTSTLADCLRQLGYNHRSWNKKIYDVYARGEMDEFWKVADAHDSFDDHPWPELYRSLDERYPGSKFILTVRKDADTWARSLETHARRRAKRTRVWHIYGMPQGQFDTEKVKQRYLAHNDEVRAYFKNRPNDLLELCWENGDGWEKLAPFLGKPTPPGPIPHTNKTMTERQFLAKHLWITFVPRFIRKGLRAVIGKHPPE